MIDDDDDEKETHKSSAEILASRKKAEEKIQPALLNSQPKGPIPTTSTNTTTNTSNAPAKKVLPSWMIGAKKQEKSYYAKPEKKKK